MSDLGRDRNDHDELVDSVLSQLLQPRGDSRHGQETASSWQAHKEANAAQRQMRRIASRVRLISETNQSTADLIVSDLSSLTRLCDQKFVSYNYDSIPPIWRAIYIDAQTIKACSVLKVAANHGQAANLRRCIRDLDLALIVAGAASTAKGQHCLDLITSLQSRLLVLEPNESDSASSARPTSCRSSPRKRPRPAQADAHDRPKLSVEVQADSSIRDFDFEHAPSFMDLAAQDSRLRCTPFIVRAYAQGAGWPAIQSVADKSSSGSWSSMEHLLTTAGPARIVPVEVGSNYIRKDWGQDMMLWSDFLRHCRWNETDPLDGAAADPAACRSVLYMAQHDLSSQFPALERDYFLPDYVYTSPPPSVDWPAYRPPTTPDGLITNLWVGPAGTVSPPHHDPFYNCFVQVVGYKEVWVAPPHCRPSKDLPRSDELCSGNAAALESGRYAGTDREASITESLMPNTASIDVFDTLEAVPPRVRAAASKAILGPGDLLYMPPTWWHSMRSLTRSFSISTWF